MFKLAFEIIQSALETGVVLKRWETVHQILLLKDEPRKKIPIFRNITLVEVDLMFGMRII